MHLDLTAHPSARATTKARARYVRRAWAADFEVGERVRHWSDAPLSLGLRALAHWSSTICVSTSERVVALTFDDGPDSRRTPGVLDALARHGVPATFFLLSSAAQRHPELVVRAVIEGHEVALHGVDHDRVVAMPPGELVDRLRDGRAQLQRLSGQPVRLYRPTYGALARGQVPAVRAAGLEPIIWSSWVRDWEPATPVEVAGRARRATHPGAILLLHDTLADVEPEAMSRQRFDSATTVELLLEQLTRQGWRFSTVTDLLASAPPVRCAWFERRATLAADS
ncbi:polysaccharide deacetylase family protein [Nocardioides pacificus]